MNRSKQPSSSSQRDQKIEHQRQLDLLEGQIRRFQIDYRRFFAGDLPLPPEGLKDQVSDAIRRMRKLPAQGVAERFRRRSLEARFNSFIELFGRQLREREQSAKPSAGALPLPDVDAGVVVRKTARSGAVEALYKRLYLREGTRNPKMDLERFKAFIDQQAEMIRSKTGCSEIVFRVAVENGKTKLKAKPRPETAV